MPPQMMGQMGGKPGMGGPMGAMPGGKPGMGAMAPGGPMMGKGMPGMGPMGMGPGGMPGGMGPMLGKGGMPGMPMGMPPQGQMMMRPPQQQQLQQQQAAQQQPAPAPGGTLNAAALANAPPAVQKQMIGEKLYPAIAKYHPDMAGKITGMMLEMDNSELLIMLESDQQLRHKVDEAMRVLDQT